MNKKAIKQIANILTNDPDIILEMEKTGETISGGQSMETFKVPGAISKEDENRINELLPVLFDNDTNNRIYRLMATTLREYEANGRGNKFFDEQNFDKILDNICKTIIGEKIEDQDIDNGLINTIFERAGRTIALIKFKIKDKLFKLFHGPRQRVTR